jgi:hypothetical protein
LHLSSIFIPLEARKQLGGGRFAEGQRVLATSYGFCQTAFQSPESVGRRIRRFVIAISLAAAGLLTLTCPASAKIVYHKVNIKIPANSSYFLDLNRDGVVDFTIHTLFSSGTCRSIPGTVIREFVDEITASGNGTEGSPPARLAEGDSIGPSQTFSGSGGTMAYFGQACNSHQHSGGIWYHASGYLGLMFQVSGETYYGWAELAVGSDTATLTGYAYEDTPGTSINAGQVPPDFNITASPTSATLSPGLSTTSTLTLTPTGGLTGTVVLSCKVPTGYGLSCGVSPSSVTLDGTNPATATLSINTSSTTPGAIYKTYAKGVSGTLVHSTTFTLTVQ